MAKTKSNTTMVFNFLLMLSFLFIFSEAENRTFGMKSAFGILEPKGSVECNLVYGVRDGGTCFSVSQTFDLTTASFDSINPNLNCTGFFIGQWLCIDGKTT